VIEKTRAQIDKLKDLKTGMMQELLTKGIGHTEFKDSPVGRIPASWNVTCLGNTGKWIGGGTPSKSIKEYWKGSIPWVSPKDMKTEFIQVTEDHISEYALRDSSTNMVKSGSILIVARSGILKHTLPVAIAAKDLTINQDMKALTVHDGFSAQFIYQYLLAKNHHVLRASLKAGNTVESLDFSAFSNLLIPCPSIEEQQKIANAVESIAHRVRVKSSQLNAYVQTKRALMQDLLTGKVRVNVDDKESAAA
jgi:type I restriction enzyme, S subunit